MSFGVVFWSYSEEISSITWNSEFLIKFFNNGVLVFKISFLWFIKLLRLRNYFKMILINFGLESILFVSL